MGDCSTAPVSEIVAVPVLTDSVFVDGISENIASVGQCKRAIVIKSNKEHTYNHLFRGLRVIEIRALIMNIEL